MTERTHQKDHYSPATRAAILDRLLTALQSDERITGLLVVESGVEGFEDAHSDIDLCAVTTSVDAVRPAFQEWGLKIHELLPVFHSHEVPRAPNIYLWTFLLENFLEIDLSFLCLDDLKATRNRWKTVFDHSGRIENIMQSSWESRLKPNLEEVYRYRLGSIWHAIKYAAIAIQRKQPWRAIYELEQIRNRTIELRGLRKELETKRFRQVDQMSKDFFMGLEQTLISSLRDVDVMKWSCSGNNFSNGLFKASFPKLTLMAISQRLAMLRNFLLAGLLIKPRALSLSFLSPLRNQSSVCVSSRYFILYTL